MRKKLFTFLLAMMASIGSLFAESGTCGLNLTWNLADSVLTISGTGAMTDYLAPWYSNRLSIKTVIINGGVSSIGNYAFSDCSGLTSVTIPNSVTSIGESAFSYCSGLTSVTIPNSVTNIEREAFDRCSSLVSVTIPNSVTNIGLYAFSDCSSLTSLTVESGNSVYDSRNNCNAIIETASNSLIAGCKNTIIPKSVTDIGTAAFLGRKGLTSVTIPDSIISIRAEAFRDCSDLTSITIPKSVSTMGGRVFSGCSSLTSVDIGSGLTLIGGDYMFSACGMLNYIIFRSSLPPIVRSSTLEGINNDVIIFVLDTTIYQNSQYWKDMNLQAICSADKSEKATSVAVNFTHNVWTLDNSYIASIGISGSEQQPGNVLEYTGLEPNSEYKDIPVVLTSSTGETDTVKVSFTTTALELTTKASKAVSSTTAILLAETNMSDAEVSCGFEWKRENAPDAMEGTKVYCPVASGQMAGRLKNLKDDVYYKYRAFYQSAAGNMYYGDWQYIFTGDATVEFDPILYTYGASVVTENEATVSGYALAGSEDFDDQGLEYWAESRVNGQRDQVPSTNGAPRRMVAGLNEHFFVPASGIKMTVTLTDLDEGTVYKYRVYGKVGDQYYYGTEQTFTTKGMYEEESPTSIEEVPSDPQSGIKAQKILRDGQIFILRGDKTYTVTGQEMK